MYGAFPTTPQKRVVNWKKVAAWVGTAATATLSVAQVLPPAIGGPATAVAAALAALFQVKGKPAQPKPAPPEVPGAE